jgi:hypothetical protein
MTISARRLAGWFGGVLGALGVGAEVAQAQDNAVSTDLGETIASAVKGAVSGDAASGGVVSGGSQVQRNALSLGDQEGLSVSDASGGSNNVSFES